MQFTTEAQRARRRHRGFWGLAVRVTSDTARSTMTINSPTPSVKLYVLCGSAVKTNAAQFTTEAQRARRRHRGFWGLAVRVTSDTARSTMTINSPTPSVKLCVLCGSVVKTNAAQFTTEAQRAQRRHRDFLGLAVRVTSDTARSTMTINSPIPSVKLGALCDSVVKTNAAQFTTEAQRARSFTEVERVLAVLMKPVMDSPTSTTLCAPSVSSVALW